MTREELEECIGYEVIVHDDHGHHDHVVLVGFNNEGHALIDDGSRHGPSAVRKLYNISCPALVARRFQEARVADAMPKLVASCPRCAAGVCSAHQPCTCGVVISACPVHCRGVVR